MMIPQTQNKKLKIFLAFFLSFFASHFVSAKTKNKEIKSSEEPPKNLKPGEGVSYYEKSKRKAKEPNKNTKARGPMDPSNRQGEGLQNVNGSRE